MQISASRSSPACERTMTGSPREPSGARTRSRSRLAALTRCSRYESCSRSNASGRFRQVQKPKSQSPLHLQATRQPMNIENAFAPRRPTSDRLLRRREDRRVAGAEHSVRELGAEPRVRTRTTAPAEIETSGWRIDCLETLNLSRGAIDVTAARPDLRDAAPTRAAASKRVSLARLLIPTPFSSRSRRPHASNPGADDARRGLLLVKHRSRCSDMTRETRTRKRSARSQ